MTIIELIEHVGVENVQCQGIESSLVKAEAKTNDGEITFATDKSKVIGMAAGNATMVGMVVWLPKDKLPQ